MPQETEHDRSAILIDAILEKENIKFKSDLSDALGYKRSTNLQAVHSKRALFNPEVKQILHDKYSANLDWLLTGKGEMFTDGYRHEKNNMQLHQPVRERVTTVVIDENDKEYITYVPLPAQAGFAREYPQENYIKRLPHFSIPGYHNGNAVAFPVEGVSMTPTLYPGDIVICEPVEKLEWIEAKDIHVIISDRGRQTKRLIYHKDKFNHEDSFLECISDNGYYNTELSIEQRKIPIQEVRHIFKVVMVISGNLPVPDETLKLIREILAKVDALTRRDINLS